MMNVGKVNCLLDRYLLSFRHELNMLIRRRSYVMKITISAAEGGDHAKRIVGDLVSAYTKYLDRKG